VFAEFPLQAQRRGLRLNGGESAFGLVEIEWRDEAGIDPAPHQFQAGFAAGQRFGGDRRFRIVSAQGEIVVADQAGNGEADGVARILAGEQAGLRRLVAAPDAPPDIKFVGGGQSRTACVDALL
jgi:hypothetical protein